MNSVVGPKKALFHNSEWSNEFKEFIGDPRWFPYSFDVHNEEFHFVLIPDDDLRETPFVRLLKSDQYNSRSVPYRSLCRSGIESFKLHLILHSSQGGSTLLAKALGQRGVATPLQEPPILTDVIAYGLRKSRSETRALLADVTRLLSRPYPGDQVVVCKLSHIGNGLSIPMSEVHSDSKILCLDTPLEDMLCSYASYGAEGRRAARKLLIGIKNSRMLAVALPDAKYSELIDLQLAALSWLSMRKMMLEAAAKFGAERVRSITTDQFMRNPRETLSAVAKHFGMHLDVENRLKSGIFDRHAKTGEPFNQADRAVRIAERRRIHRAEIQPIVDWITQVAESAGVAWHLPFPLLG